MIKLRKKPRILLKKFHSSKPNFKLFKEKRKDYKTRLANYKKI